MTKWRADCLEHTLLLRTYAFWRTLPRHLFNSRFSFLELGAAGRLTKQLGYAAPDAWFRATKPGEKPFRVTERTPTAPGDYQFETVQAVGKTWAQVLAQLPVGSHVVWHNADAERKCVRKPGLPFCAAWRNEHTTKVGPDRYKAHPFGIIDEKTVKQKMAEEVTGPTVPPGYIEANIFVNLAVPPEADPPSP